MHIYTVIEIAFFYVLVAAGETLNGIARTICLNKRFGVRTAKKLSLLPALLLCLLICYFYVPVMGFTTDAGLLLLGASLSVFMLAFDIAMWRLVARAKWQVILEDFDIRKGNLLGPGLVVMAFCPLIASRIPHIFQHAF